MTDDVNKIPDKKPSDDLKLKDLRNDRLGLDSLMDDMIGLNIQGFKSLLAVCFRPAQYFQSAKLADWGGKYRSSFRILFAILALTAATRFIWANENSPMLLDAAAMFDQWVIEEVNRAKKHGQVLDTSTFNSIEASSLAFKKLMLALPFVVTFGFAFFAWAYRAWGERLSYVVRLRYTYAVLVPSMTLGLLSSFVTIILPQAAFNTYTVLSYVLAVLTVAITAYFGPFKNQETGARIGRSISAGLCMMGFYLLLVIVAITPLLIPVFESVPHHDHSLPMVKAVD